MIAYHRLMCLHLSPFLLRQVNFLEDIGHKLLKDRILSLSFIDHKIDNLHNDGRIVLIHPHFELNCLAIIILVFGVPADHSHEIEFRLTLVFDHGNGFSQGDVGCLYLSLRVLPA